jgi:hypothetical protein
VPFGDFVNQIPPINMTVSYGFGPYWVRAESDGPGKGSTFTVFLPLVQPAGEEEAVHAGSGFTPFPAVRASEAVLSGLRLMIVDDETDARELIEDILRGAGANVVGASSAREAAVRCVKTWGTACFVGEGGDVKINVSPDLLRRQVTLIGSWTFSAMGMAECAKFIDDNNIDLERIFSHRWKLEQADEAYRSFDTQSTGKGVFLL